MAGSTELMVADNARAVGRPRINAPGETMTARFRSGTLARIEAVLGEREAKSDLIRDAVERELERREKQ